MSPIDVVLILAALLLLLVFLGFRVAFAAALVGMIGLWVHFAIFKDLSLIHI